MKTILSNLDFPRARPSTAAGRYGLLNCGAAASAASERAANF